MRQTFKLCLIWYNAILFWIMMAVPNGITAELETMIRLSSASLSAGKTLEFSIYIHNYGVEQYRFLLPDRLACRLLQEGQELHLVGQALSPLPEEEITVPPQAFAGRRYGLIIPAELSGPVILEVEDLNTPPVMFMVMMPPPEESPMDDKEQNQRQADYDSLEDLFTLYQPYLKNITAYEPIYFLVGADPEDSKFQISFKFQFFNAQHPLAKAHTWIKGFHFGYTQTSFWDLKSDSAPFADTSYKPELFYTSSNIRYRPKWMNGCFLQTGGRHESNGRGGEFSRSTNIIYAKPIFIFYNETHELGLQIAPKIWSYAGNDNDTNPDLGFYRGYFDIEFKIGKTDGLVLGSNLGWAEEGVSLQLDLTYPLNQLFRNNIDLYFQLQYVNSLAESLVNYEEHSESVRLGFALVR